MGLITKWFPVETKTVFGTGQAHELAMGVKSGYYCGTHIVKIERFIDEDTGEEKGVTNNPLNGVAQPLAKDDIQEHLGRALHDVDAQFRDLDGRLKHSEQALKAERAEHAATRDSLADCQRAIGKVQNQLQRANQMAMEAQSQLAHVTQQRDALKGKAAVAPS